ncbi:3-keto-5-aminohexanoate cleavage protein [Phaeobacter sp. QD34_3]|uniref:3-keto-5-aminohexanoate cleavage protein n=1 Tax=unclassified Phaeobacter TaxID=2621772 RepID=UPI00237FA808|nr:MULTISPECIES: 3-keto-5-aminohexanoate cleavage protein [unclassified Phaeobacter]MDE4132637.1 3-keto-5-aminohexanoate cleavage protein [Phaeobacter sp. QD34_3]MDE4136273.1 3-keto-5-aminohexanoate cleavage protein [Phaeobacter sp. QD34_24]
MADFRVMVAPNGARRDKQHHAALPITVEEVVETAARCHAAGAGALHLHVRDDAGRHSLDAGRYREALAVLAQAVPGMAVQITTESAGVYGPQDQLHCLEELRPPWASVSVREMARDPGVAARAYAISAEAGTRVQHILYGPSCIQQLRAWYKDGTVPSGMREAIFVLGQYAPPVLAEPDHLAGFLSATADLDLAWTACAFGRNERACLLAAIAAGGDARIGFENNLETPDGALLQDNAASVAALVNAAQTAGHCLKEG